MATTARVPRPAPPPGGDALAGSVLAHEPELLRAFLRFYGTLWSHGVLDQATKEVARLRNARITDCRYCRNVRFAGARDEGLSEAMVAQIADGFEESGLGARHKAVIRFADVFLTDPTALRDDLRAELLAHFSPAEVVELATTLALCMGFSKIAVVLGQEPESMPTTIVPTPARPG